MSTLSVDVCPSSFMSYLLPIYEQYVFYETIDLKPHCVGGKAPFRLMLTIYQGNAPYNGDVNISIDGAYYITVSVADGQLNVVIYADPGTHDITLETMQGNAVTLIGVAFACYD